MLDKRYEPQALASSSEWTYKTTGKPYTIMMPPPNVTGHLHVGHALNYTLQDILVRYKRLQGYDVLWQPGTDHAGIATQLVVKRQLPEDVDRETFLTKAWEWTAYAKDVIVNQQKKLAIAPNWERARFTFDADFNRAVNHVFKRLYDDGLIAKAKRLVHYDFSMKTAVSDLEAIHKDTEGALVYIRYANVCGNDIKDDLIIATTRPETMFGDTAIAIHPKNPALKHWIGKHVAIPLSGRVIPVIADTYADPEKGSGAVKITPAHDFNDFEVGQRHNLEIINIYDDCGRLNDHAPEPYQGFTIEEARLKVLADLQSMNAIVKTETVKHAVPFGEKSGCRLEPRLTDQWYLDAAQMAQPAIEALKQNQLRFFPEKWQNTYLHWLENIQPWCISRQLWWGHRIPVWTDAQGKVYVAESEEDAQKLAGTSALTQDPDVLDTWFSASLWPFVTLDWPDNFDHKYFPTDALITGFDIIFFWVARMTMMSLYFTKQVPFRDVYIHTLVRDAQGQKMSKTKGNVIDPLTLIDKYGVDALRLTLCALSVPGCDILLGDAKIEGYRHFNTKLWNAGRFLQMQTFQNETHPHDTHDWMWHQLRLATEAIEAHMRDYRFDLYVKTLYDLVWTKFCDVYLEGIKALPCDTTPVQIYKQILVLCHPIMPHITQALWSAFDDHSEVSWRVVLAYDETRVKHVDHLIVLAEKIRSICAAVGVKGKVDLGSAQAISPVLCYLAPVQNITTATEGIPVPYEDGTVYLNLTIDREVLQDKIATLEKEKSYFTNILHNEKLKTSKPDLWAQKQTDYERLEQEIAILTSL